MREDDRTIQVRIGELRQLFNPMDPSPFNERDLDPAAEEHIVAWARELPPDGPLRVSIQVAREQPTPTALADTVSAVRTHFARAATLERLKLRRLVRDGRMSLLIGLVSLVLCIGGATAISQAAPGPLGRVIGESLIIAGWVVMWRPLELLLYGWWPVLRERRLLDRLAAAEVVLGAPG